MSLKAFFNFVELPTKIASVIPFILALLYTIYAYNGVNIGLTIIMFLSMILFDMTTTAINNYCDYKNEKKHMKNISESRNPLVVHGIGEFKAKTTIFTMLTVSMIFGVVLVFKTNIFVLVLGVICFVVGIFYTYGPIPISRMPLGEIFSGIFMGLFIPFLTIYINTIDESQFGIFFSDGNTIFSFNIISAITIFIISIPMIFCIANIMLANNICDLEDDIKVKRYTLVYYLGKEISIKIYKYLYYGAYLGIAAGVIFNILPILSLLVFITFKGVTKNIKLFEKEQIKSKTFILAIKNFVMISITYIVSIIGAIIIGFFI